MTIENLDEVKSYFEANKDNEDVKGYIKGFISLDGVKNFLEANEDGKKYLNSYADSKVSKGIESFKQNNLSKLVEEEMKKLNPQLDPKDMKLQELQNKFEALEKEKARETLTNKALKIASEKKLPVDLVNYFLGQDEESTLNNLFALEKSLQSYTQSVRESIIKEGSYIPPANDKAIATGTVTQTEYDKNKNNLDWYSKNKAKVLESYRQGLIK
jgi:predicted nuclease with TOPRIM domain